MMSTVELITADKRQISDWSSGTSEISSVLWRKNSTVQFNSTQFNDNSVAIEEGVENDENVDDLDILFLMTAVVMRVIKRLNIIFSF